MGRHVLFPVSELAEGGTRIVEIGGRSIGVMNVRGELYAMRNRCPHHGAPLCRGAVAGTMVPSRPHSYVYDPDFLKIHCPWHGYEFRLDTGEPVAPGIALRVKLYRVAVEDGDVVLYS
jgi:nitrite reductase (NADH) small subunit